MDTKRLGNIGEALTQAEFVMRGIPLYLPFGENEKSDMIIDLDGRYSLKVSVPFKESKNQSDPINWEDYTFDKVLKIPKLDCS